MRRLFLLPSWTFLAGLFLLPLGIVFAYSFLSRGLYGGVTNGWTWASYRQIADPLYLGILVRTFAMSALATALCLVLGFPLALFIARAKTRRNFYLQLVMLPFWTSFLIRTYAWMFLLRDTGPVNALLLNLGLVSSPLPLLYNNGAVLLGLVYGFLPFAVLPMYATLERLDPGLEEAAADLGAKPLEAVARVIVPLCAPGFRAAAVLVFIPCLGAYLTPDLLGGGKSVMMGTLIQNQFTTARDWPFGAALALILMILVAGLLLLVRRERNPIH